MFFSWFKKLIIQSFFSAIESKWILVIYFAYSFCVVIQSNEFKGDHLHFKFTSSTNEFSPIRPPLSKRHHEICLNKFEFKLSFKTSFNWRAHFWLVDSSNAAFQILTYSDLLSSFNICNAEFWSRDWACVSVSACLRLNTSVRMCVWVRVFEYMCVCVTEGICILTVAFFIELKY